MDLKFFSGRTAMDAKEQAAAYYSCSEEDLYIEVYRKGDSLTQWLILAVPSRYGVPKHADGRYEILYDPTGVYLEIYPSIGNGHAANGAQMQKYIQRKGIRQMNPKEVMKVVATGGGRAKIAPAQESVTLDEELEIVVSPDGLSCTMTFMPADENGKLLDIDGVRYKLREAGVVYGLKEEEILAATAEKEFFKPYLIAEGVASVSGENGRLIIHFNHEKTGKPIEQEDGRVDYRALDLFEPVKEGQLLVTRIPATPGTPGRSVLDAEIPPRPGKEAIMPNSKNTDLNEDRTAMTSQKNGMVELAGGKVIVTDVYTVTGDCDLSVGNIDFDGSVKVTGNVISGMTIKASGGIYIGGVVEGAELVAEGSIELKRGMQGMDKGKLTAGGSISAMFLERCTAIAYDDIHADAIIHSVVEAGRDIFVSGKRGGIMGGVARCTGKLVAKTLGSVSHSQTEIELGIIPSKRLRMKELSSEIEDLSQQVDKLSKILAFLDKPDNNLPPEKARILKISSAANLRSVQRSLAAFTAEQEILMEEAKNAVNGKVHVSDTAYGGVKISIASATLKINDSIVFSTFRYKEGEVVYAACEQSSRRR